jgi:hypothetical protein
MNVKELINILKKEKQDMEVVFSCDEEGNMYSKTASIIPSDFGNGKIKLVFYPNGDDADE